MKVRRGIGKALTSVLMRNQGFSKSFIEGLKRVPGKVSFRIPIKVPTS